MARKKKIEETPIESITNEEKEFNDYDPSDEQSYKDSIVNMLPDIPSVLKPTDEDFLKLSKRDFIKKYNMSTYEMAVKRWA
jgi:hypothetical protein